MNWGSQQKKQLHLDYRTLTHLMEPQAYNLAMQTRVPSDLPECENTAGETLMPKPRCPNPWRWGGGSLHPTHVYIGAPLSYM